MITDWCHCHHADDLHIPDEQGNHTGPCMYCEIPWVRVGRNLVRGNEIRNPCECQQFVGKVNHT